MGGREFGGYFLTWILDVHGVYRYVGSWEREMMRIESECVTDRSIIVSVRARVIKWFLKGCGRKSNI